MKELKKAFFSREGKAALLGVVLGILVSSLGGYLLRDHMTLCDVVVILGAVFSMVGSEQFIRLILYYREHDD